jgi:MFS family permease
MGPQPSREYARESNVNCTDAGWSAVTSATANATLAGVLAGFMLNGIIVLLSRQIREFAKVRALGLLFTAFVALALDSYLFGLVTGESTCRRAWTEAMLAAGLLGMGAVAIIAGFGLLVAEYVPSRGNNESTQMLRTLFNVLRGGVALVVLTVLFMTSWNYLYAIFGDKVPAILKHLLLYYLGISAVAIVVIVVNATMSGRLQRMRLQPQRWISIPGKALWNTSARLAGEGDLSPQVKRAIYWSFGYTVLSVIAASILARTSPHPWDSLYLWVKVISFLTIGWVLIVSLFPLFYLLVRCSPPFSDGRDALTLTLKLTPYLRAAVNAYRGTILEKDDAAKQQADLGSSMLLGVFGPPEEGESLPKPLADLLAGLAAHPNKRHALAAARLTVWETLAANQELVVKVQAILADAKAGHQRGDADGSGLRSGPSTQASEPMAASVPVDDA